MKTLSLKPFYIAGCQHADAHLVSDIPKGTFLTVTHDPKNRWDPFALVVSLNGVKLGHIPRTDQATFVYHIGQNVNVLLRVVTFDKTQPPYKWIECEWVCDDKYMTVVTNLTKALTE